MTVLTTLEIGSTITKANAFRMESGLLHHIGQGFAPTSVAAGDVRIGADAAIAQMREQCASPPAAGEIFVNSSAAGGLRMSVHGLTRSMTARLPAKRLRRRGHCHYDHRRGNGRVRPGRSP